MQDAVFVSLLLELDLRPAVFAQGGERVRASEVIFGFLPEFMDLRPAVFE